MTNEMRDALLSTGKSNRISGYWLAIHVLQQESQTDAAQFLINFAKGSDLENNNPYDDEELLDRIQDKASS